MLNVNTFIFCICLENKKFNTSCPVAIIMMLSLGKYFFRCWKIFVLFAEDVTSVRLSSACSTAIIWRDHIFCFGCILCTMSTVAIHFREKIRSVYLSLWSALSSWGCPRSVHEHNPAFLQQVATQGCHTDWLLSFLLLLCNRLCDLSLSRKSVQSSSSIYICIRSRSDQPPIKSA